MTKQRQYANSPELMTDQVEEIVTDVFPFDDAALDRLFDAEASQVW